MLAVQPSRTRLQPSTPQLRELVRAELERLLQSPHFTSSKRYPAFLRYVVETTLNGRADDLKERTLGVEVFHRKPDYDTNSDTTVRFAAGEVRKRLALVYHESDDDSPVRIMLSPGSYVPEFLFMLQAESESIPTPVVPTFLTVDHRLAATSPASETERNDHVSSTIPRRWFRSSQILLLVLAFVAVALAGWLARMRTIKEQTAVDLFWQPAMASPNPTILSAGALVFAPTPSGVVMASRGDDYPYISMATAGTLTRLAEMFGRKNLRYEVQPTSAVTLADMRERPVVLIGAYNNAWTLRMLDGLRYRFSPQALGRIYDSTDPSRFWQRPAGTPYNNAIDYAIVARYRDSVTNNVVVILAGVGKNGTEAATQFATTNGYLELLDRQNDMGRWETRNLEVVLKTTVIDGKTGAPTIEAAYVW